MSVEFPSFFFVEFRGNFWKKSFKQSKKNLFLNPSCLFDHTSPTCDTSKAVLDEFSLYFASKSNPAKPVSKDYPSLSDHWSRTLPQIKLLALIRQKRITFSAESNFSSQIAFTRFSFFILSCLKAIYRAASISPTPQWLGSRKFLFTTTITTTHNTQTLYGEQRKKLHNFSEQFFFLSFLFSAAICIRLDRS